MSTITNGLDRRNPRLDARLARSVWWSFFLLLLLLTTASVPVNAQPTGWFFADAQCDNGIHTVTFSGLDPGGHPEVVGFDVYRSNNSACGTQTRLTDDPLPRASNQSFSFQVVDSNVIDGQLYGYHIVGVDAGRTTTVSLYTLFPLPGASDIVYAGCNAPRGHGIVVDWGWTLAIDPCPDSCLPFMHLESGMEELQPYIGLPVQVYGSMGFTIEGWGLDLESWSFLTCTVAIEDTRWSNIKSLFR
jgi:hypothetical protein